MVNKVGSAGTDCGEALHLITEAQEAIRQLAWENFQRRGGRNGDARHDWLDAEKELFRVPDIRIEQTTEAFQIEVDIRDFRHSTIRVMVLPAEIIVAADLEKRQSGEDIKPLYRRIWLGPIEGSKVETRVDNRGKLLIDVCVHEQALLPAGVPELGPVPVSE
jgi:hypothetical protein